MTPCLWRCRTPLANCRPSMSFCVQHKIPCDTCCLRARSRRSSCSREPSGASSVMSSEPPPPRSTTSPRNSTMFGCRSTCRAWGHHKLRPGCSPSSVVRVVCCGH
eukprot:2102541-Prymnesium_polylepis.1